MHPFSDKSFHAFGVGADVFNVAEPVLLRALLEGFDAGIGIHRVKSSVHRVQEIRRPGLLNS